MAALTLKTVEPWAPHPTAAPVTAKDGDALVIAGNGTRTCSGGWQLVYTGVTGGQTYAVSVDVEHAGIEHARDSLRCVALWGSMPADTAVRDVLWEYLIPERISGSRLRMTARLTAPDGAEVLTLRHGLRWTTGRSMWMPPTIEAVDTPPTRRVTISLVTGRVDSRPAKVETIDDNVEFYTRLCEAACRRDPDIIVLPEVAIQWQLAGHPLDVAVAADSPATQPFMQIARAHRTRILLGLFERDGDAVFNTAMLISPAGEIEMRYRKVHLAVGDEIDSGIRPGDEFNVIDTELGRLGCNVCMDSSAVEASRMVGLAGAEILMLPIMGDHRASRWRFGGAPIFNSSRWTAIMRTRALDNQLCMAVARNNAIGSCIIDRKGDILAWNEGDVDVVDATVALDDGYRTWNGGCFRGVNWMQRRPHTYDAFTDSWAMGGL